MCSDTEIYAERTGRKMSFKYKNEKIADWLSAHHAVAEENCEMAEKVELLENVWHMDDGAESS